jgi:hypothetical protein
MCNEMRGLQCPWSRCPKRGRGGRKEKTIKNEGNHTNVSFKMLNLSIKHDGHQFFLSFKSIDKKPSIGRPDASISSSCPAHQTPALLYPKPHTISLYNMRRFVKSTHFRYY